jgi:hypothetical protein|tara:strand:+ start:134 stop:583 length:450 start_codon:yes stop_codon:yes gene_type:complete
MFGIFKNKDAEEVASEINKIHNQIYKLRKKNTDGTYSISKKVIEKEFKSNKLKTTKNGTEWKILKKETKWTMFVGEIIMHYSINSKNKDELYASYSASSTYPGYYFGVMSSAREKKWTSVAFFQVPDNDNGKAVKEILVNDYKFKGIEQ